MSYFHDLYPLHVDFKLNDHRHVLQTSHKNCSKIIIIDIGIYPKAFIIHFLWYLSGSCHSWAHIKRDMHFFCTVFGLTNVWWCFEMLTSLDRQLIVDVAKNYFKNEILSFSILTIKSRYQILTWFSSIAFSKSFGGFLHLILLFISFTRLFTESTFT